MEKKCLYTAPAVRFLAMQYEVNFMLSAGGSIDDWSEDDDEINF